MLAVQEVALGAGDEELAAIGLFATVRHGQQSRRVVFQGKILVAEGVAVYTGNASAVALDKVAALDHEVLDHPVEAGALVANGDSIRPVLARAELPKVFRRAGYCVRKQLEYHSSDFLPPKGVKL